jgi:predicted nucleotidyltransferase
MADILSGSKAKAAIIRLFYTNEDKRFHMREVARLLGINVNQARRELVRLAETGVLKMENVGNLHLFQVDGGYMLHDELALIVRKSAGFEHQLANELGRVSGVRFAFIFGSYAEAKFTRKSDIDLMIIGKPAMGELNQAVVRAEKMMSRSIQYVVYPLDEFRKKRGYGFVKNVMGRKKIFVIGDADELERA